MIFFVPGYDPATQANLEIARRVLPDGCIALLGEQATRSELLAALTTVEEPLFGMSHGRPNKLLGQGGDMALAMQDAQRIGHRAVFVYACHTATDLGESMAGSGALALWWGYTGSITAPETSEVLLPLFSRIFAYICGAFPGALSAEARRATLLRLSELCHEAERGIDDLLISDPELDAGSAYLCLLHIWDRLRIWEPGAREPECHPDSRPPILF